MKSLIKRTEKLYPGKHKFIVHQVGLIKGTMQEKFQMYIKGVKWKTGKREFTEDYTPKFSSLLALKNYVKEHIIAKTKPKEETDGTNTES